jgi:hypothetical protein
VNVAAQSNGGVASASSALSSYPASSANNGDRKGGSSGVWADGTPGSAPDSLQIVFSGSRKIAEIDVFTVQDNYSAPADPTLSMSFTRYGITAFRVQYWSGSAWVNIPGATVTGNVYVWRRFTFTPISATAIRILVDSTRDAYARITEVEAWSTP